MSDRSLNRFKLNKSVHSVRSKSDREFDSPDSPDGINRSLRRFRNDGSGSPILKGTRNNLAFGSSKGSIPMDRSPGLKL